jgi:hypothetical protein
MINSANALITAFMADSQLAWSSAKHGRQQWATIIMSLMFNSILYNFANLGVFQ